MESNLEKNVPSDNIKNNIEQYSLKKLTENYEELIKLSLEKQKIIKEMENKILNSSNVNFFIRKKFDRKKINLYVFFLHLPFFDC